MTPWVASLCALTRTEPDEELETHPDHAAMPRKQVEKAEAPNWASIVGRDRRLTRTGDRPGTMKLNDANVEMRANERQGK